MERVRISLKYKILGGIFLLLVLAIGTSIHFANDLMLKDKTAYVYETGLKQAEGLSQQFLEQIRNMADKAILYSVIDKTSPEKLIKLVNSDKNLIFFSIYSDKEDSTSIKTEIVNDKLIDNLSGSYNVNTQKLNEKSFSDLISKMKSSDRELLVEVFSQELGVPSLVILLRNQDGGEIYLFVSNIDNISEKFGDDQLFDNYIMDNKGLSFLDIKGRKTNLFKKIYRMKGFKGTTEMEGEDGKTMMASYIRYKDYNINIISLISKDRALAVIKALQHKSIFFGAALLSLSIVFGIIFSSKISLPIRQLLAGTKNIAKGIFNEKIVVKTHDELALLANSFNFMSGEIQGLLQNKQVMIEKLEDAKLQLEDYNKNLEAKVKVRTKELREANSFIEAMINSLDQGLMVFGPDAICRSFFTSACIEMFGESPAERPFYEVLGLNDSDTKSFSSWAEVVFSQKIPFQSAKGLGPKDKVTGNNYADDDFKFLSFDYHPMNNQDGNIENIVAVVTDKTKRVQAEEISKEKEAYSSMILRIINNKKQFISFMKESEAIITNIENESDSEAPRMDYFMMNFHSLNGGFGIYHVNKLQSMARSIETKIADFKKGPIDEKEFFNELQKDILSYKNSFLKFKSECALFIGGSIDEESNNLTITKEVKEELFQKIESGDMEELKKYYVEYFIKTPIVEGFKAYEELVENVSSQLNKSIAPLCYDGGDMRVNMPKYEDFLNTLVHLFRNCVDHGIEAPHDRVEIGKPESGNITIRFDKSSQQGKDYLLVEVQDDGGGIDPQIIRERLLKVDAKNDFSAESDEEIIYHIFDSSFSTRDEVTTVSGRGVGMSAIKDIVLKKAGHIHLQSKLGQGSKFQFYLPYV